MHESSMAQNSVLRAICADLGQENKLLNEHWVEVLKNLPDSQRTDLALEYLERRTDDLVFLRLACIGMAGGSNDALQIWMNVRKAELVANKQMPSNCNSDAASNTEQANVD